MVSRPPPESSRWAIQRQPLVLFVVAICAGILFDRYCEATWWRYLAVFLAALAIWSGAFWRRTTAIGSLALLVSAGAIGALHHHIWWNFYPSGSVHLATGPSPTNACVRGIVKREPRWRLPPPDDLFDATPPSVSTSFTLSVESIRDGRTWRDANGCLNVYVAGQVSAVHSGDRVTVVGRLQHARTPGNPGEIDFAWYARAHRIPTSLSADQPNCVRIVKRNAVGAPSRVIARLRSRLDAAIWQYVSAEPNLASAILLGIRDNVDDDEKESFMATGTIHLLAISGLHVGILTGCLLAIGRLLRIRKNWMLTATIGFVLFYCALVDYQPSVVRASILISVWCLAKLLLRNGFSFNSLALSGFVVLALNPTSLFQVGAQLSFMAFASITLARPLMQQSHTRDPLDQLIDESRSWPVRWLRRGWANLCSLYAYSFFITLFAFPLVANRFHLVSPIGLLINPLLMFPIAIALQAGFGTLVFAGWLSPVAAVFGSACDLSLQLIRGMVDWAATVPMGHVWTTGPSLFATLVYYAVAFFVFVYRPTRLPFRWAFAVSLVCLTTTWLIPEIRFARSKESALQVTFIDVGHGGATFVQFPQKQNLLFDAGSMDAPGTTAQRISGVLWHAGVHHLDAVIISHDDLDHYSALLRLTQKFTIGCVYMPPNMIRQPSKTVEFLLKELARLDIQVVATWAGQSVHCDSGVVVEILHPPKDYSFESDNAGSIVAHIEYANQSVLLTADVEGEGLDMLMAQSFPRPCVAMIPHHGSRFSDPVEFVRWAHAESFVVCNSDVPPLEFLPNASGLGEGRPRIWVTGRDGAIRVRLEADHPSVQNWLNDPWPR